MSARPAKRWLCLALSGALLGVGTLVAPLPAPSGLEEAQAADAWTSTTAYPAGGKTVAKSFAVGAPGATAQINVKVGGLSKGQSVYTRLMLRATSKERYLAQLRLTSGGDANVAFLRDSKGKRTVLAVKVLPALNLSTARTLAFDLRNAGGFPVLKLRQYVVGTAAPAWQLTHTDKSAGRLIQGLGGGVQTSASANLGAKKATVSYTGLKVTKNATPSTYVDGWGEPTFADEFTGTAISNKWAVRDRVNLSYDWGQVLKSNVSVGNGAVTLKTKKLATPFTANGRQRTHSSAYIDSMKSFSQACGRWEMRAKLPLGSAGTKGIWPAFWLRPDDAGHGEIDIFEYYGNPVDRAFQPQHRTEGTVHYDSVNKTGKYKVSAWTPVNVALDDGKFHTWAVEWTPQKIVFLVDSKPYYSVDKASDSRWARVYGSGRKYNIRINVQIGSEYWGRPTDKQTAAVTNYEIDYVRAWRFPG